MTTGKYSERQKCIKKNEEDKTLHVSMIRLNAPKAYFYYRYLKLKLKRWLYVLTCKLNLILR